MSTAAAGWAFGLLLLAIGTANLAWVHPAPAIAYALLALVYLPPVCAALEKRCGIVIPAAVKLVLGAAALWFTLGVSDLGDMID